MRRIIVGSFVSLDGVMQAPGGPDEDPTGGFKHGGWVVPYWDEAIEGAMGEIFSTPFDLLLGRKTYDIFAAHWPYVEHDPAASSFDELNSRIARQFNAITKYVATHSPDTLTWQNSQGLGADVPAAIRELKNGEGRPLLVQGSSELMQVLLGNDLIDELRLVIFPLVLGKGKRLFGPGALPAAFRLTQSRTGPKGAIIANYERAGEIGSGLFGMETPTEMELERRKNLS